MSLPWQQITNLPSKGYIQIAKDFFADVPTIIYEVISENTVLRELQRVILIFLLGLYVCIALAFTEFIVRIIIYVVCYFFKKVDKAPTEPAADPSDNKMKEEDAVKNNAASNQNNAVETADDTVDINNENDVIEAAINKIEKDNKEASNVNVDGVNNQVKEVAGEGANSVKEVVEEKANIILTPEDVVNKIDETTKEVKGDEAAAANVEPAKEEEGAKSEINDEKEEVEKKVYQLHDEDLYN